MPNLSAKKGAPSTQVPRELVNIGGTAAAIFAVVASGSALAELAPMDSVWLTAGAYLAPAGVVFVIYRWIVQKL